MMAIDALTPVGKRKSEGIVIVGMPLIARVRLYRRTPRLLATRLHHRPSVLPFHIEQMEHSSVGSCLTETNELVACHATLMHSVRVIDHLALIRTVNILAANSKLPTLRHSACRSQNIVIAVLLIEFRTFHSVVPLNLSVIDEHRTTYSNGSIGRKFAHSKHAVKSATAVGPSIDEIDLAVIVP